MRFLTRDEFQRLDDERMALADKKKSETGEFKGASLWEIVKEPVIWEVPWYYDPEDPTHPVKRDVALESIAKGGTEQHYLSPHYWQTWSLIRAPLTCLCPNGREWTVDARSSNGNGWQVSFGDAEPGDALIGIGPRQYAPARVIASPSILVPGYHGFLGHSGARPGEFTRDLDGNP